jgi:hypothetical protein
MEKPLCRVCGERHWAVEGHRFKGDRREADRAVARGPSAVTSRVRTRPVEVLASGASTGRRGGRSAPEFGADEDLPSYAPPNECKYCDARRLKAKAGMKKRRAAAKRKGDE